MFSILISFPIFDSFSMFDLPREIEQKEWNPNRIETQRDDIVLVTISGDARDLATFD